MARLRREDYAVIFGPTKGDQIRLGDIPRARPLA